MEQIIALENFKETDFLNSFELKEKSDLNIRVFLDKSLTNYLHFYPQSTADELTKNGNYQFTFIVDSKKIYVENLNIELEVQKAKSENNFQSSINKFN
jgi:hypothetical protein